MTCSYTPPGALAPLSCGTLSDSSRWGRGVTGDIQFDNYRLLYLLEGKGRLYLPGGETRPLRTGSLLIRRPGWRHSLNRFSRWTEYFVAFPPSFGFFMEETGLLDPDRIIYRPGRDAVLDRMRREVDQALKSRESLSVITRAIMALVEGFREYDGRGEGRRRQNRLLPAVEMLENQRYFMHTLPEIAEGCGMAYENFRKLFKREYGLSPGEYRIKVRMELARDYLSRRELSVGRVAEELHYPDVYTFSRQFKKWFAMSPREYRNSLWV